MWNKFGWGGRIRTCALRYQKPSTIYQDKFSPHSNNVFFSPIVTKITI